MVLANDFWENFFLFLIFLPLAMVWAFALLDIFRRDDMGGGLKALWVATVILVPFLGTLMYLLFRRPGATPQEREMLDQQSRDFVQKYSPSRLSPSGSPCWTCTIAAS